MNHTITIDNDELWGSMVVESYPEWDRDDCLRDIWFAVTDATLFDVFGPVDLNPDHWADMSESDLVELVGQSAVDVIIDRETRAWWDSEPERRAGVA